MATICKNIQERIEEQVWKPVDDWVERTEERCEEYDWWNPIGWFCWLVTIVVKIARWILVPVITFVFRVVCEVVNFFLNLAAAVINIVLAIPIIGPLIKAIIRAFVTAASYVVGLLDGFGRLLGIRITKHLRVHVIPLCEGVIPLAYGSHLAPIMRETERILYVRAQIRVHTTFHEPIRNPPKNALHLGTEVDLILDEAWLKGTWHQMQTVKIFESNLWSLLAVGHPIVVYVVREVGYDGQGKVIGASGGPFTDWVAVERDSVVEKVVADATGLEAAKPLSPYPPTVASSTNTKPVDNPSYAPRLIAHEICHSLGLLGHENSNPGELMVSGKITGDALSPFQVGIIRSSGHVTFL
ncbi:MAG TPA: hypothetical protein VF644_16775 [Pyrinomonadaceae bacterium]|jgi:hypothetical protein